MENGLTLDQVLAALWRRRWLVGAVFAACLVAGAAWVMAMPDVYEASAVVRYDIQHPEPEMVRRTVGEMIEGRLATVRQELLSRTVLEEAIREFGLYRRELEEDGMDTAVAAMRKDVAVKVEGEVGFELAVRAPEGAAAAAVANRLPALLAEQNLAVRRAQADRASRAFDAEISRLRDESGEWERRIAAYKLGHGGELPEQLEANMRGLERLAAAMAARTEALHAAEVRRSDLSRAGWAHDSEAGRMAAAEQQAAQQLAVARQSLGEDHPELERLERESEALAAKRVEAEGRMTSELRERGRAVEAVAEHQRALKGLQAESAALQARLDATPGVAHALAVMERDYEILRTKYQALVSRKVEADLSRDLESLGASALYNVVSPAVVPSTPIKPDRVGGMGVVLLLALGAAVLVGTLVDLRDDRIRDGDSVRRSLQLPVLGAISRLGGTGGRRTLVPAPQVAAVTVDGEQGRDG